MGRMAAFARELIAVGVTGDALVTAIERIEAAEAALKSPGARRMAAYRERKREASLVTHSDAEYPPLSDKENGTKEINSSPPSSLRSVHTARETEIEDAQFAEFWLAYPNKVGKPKARTSFAKALKRDDFEVIMDGLRRYVRQRPPDRDWLNPATFLNQERWNDEPATVPERNVVSTASRQQSVLDGVAQAVERRMRFGGWEAQADAWRRGVNGADTPDRGFDFGISPEPKSGAG